MPKLKFSTTPKIIPTTPIENSEKHIAEDGRCITHPVLIESLIPSDYNPREISEKARQGLTESIKTFGLVQPIIVNERTGNVVGGHQRLQVMLELGFTHTDVVKVRISPAKEKALNLTLNNKYITGDFVAQSYNAILEEIKLEDLSINIEDLNLLPISIDSPDETVTAAGKESSLQDGEDKYTAKVEIPIYTPSEIKPAMEECYNTSRYDSLIESIDKSNIGDSEKAFLRLCATRHIIFDYDKIADFYSHAKDDIKQLMEKSALVIIDYNKAIEYGFVNAVNALKEVQAQDE